MANIKSQMKRIKTNEKARQRNKAVKSELRTHVREEYIATILEVGDWGLRSMAWEDLDLVQHWRRFLTTPEAYLRHLSDDAAAP